MSVQTSISRSVDTVCDNTLIRSTSQGRHSFEAVEGKDSGNNWSNLIRSLWSLRWQKLAEPVPVHALLCFPRARQAEKQETKGLRLLNTFFLFLPLRSDSICNDFREGEFSFCFYVHQNTDVQEKVAMETQFRMICRCLSADPQQDCAILQTALQLFHRISDLDEQKSAAPPSREHLAPSIVVDAKGLMSPLIVLIDCLHLQWNFLLRDKLDVCLLLWMHRERHCQGSLNSTTDLSLVFSFVRCVQNDFCCLELTAQMSDFHYLVKYVLVKLMICAFTFSTQNYKTNKSTDG